jgi:hypothetical protein
VAGWAKVVGLSATLQSYKVTPGPDGWALQAPKTDTPDAGYWRWLMDRGGTLGARLDAPRGGISH